MTAAAIRRRQSASRRLHHRVYVVRLENPRGDGRVGYYVGMTGLPLAERYANHKRGYKSARIVRNFGVGLAWELFEGIPAMTYQEAALAEPTLADDLRDLGLLVYGPTNRQPTASRWKDRRRPRAKRRPAPAGRLEPRGPDPRVAEAVDRSAPATSARGPRATSPRKAR
jgi:hypothetical protein